MDVRWFLAGWTPFTVIRGIASRRIHGAMAVTFTLSLAGFILPDLGHFGFPALNVAAAYVLIGCALSAWYMMARILLNELAGREVLPAGRAWWRDGGTRPTVVPVPLTPQVPRAA